MKIKLIANGIINLITATGLVLFFIGFFKIVNKALDVADNPIEYVFKILKSDAGFETLLSSAYMAIAGIVIMAITWMVQIVVGIFIISTSKSVRHNRWLVLVTGALSLVGGLGGLNAIFSFVGAWLIKEKKRK